MGRSGDVKRVTTFCTSYEMLRHSIERYQHQLLWSPIFAFPTEGYDIFVSILQYFEGISEQPCTQKYRRKDCILVLLHQIQYDSFFAGQPISWALLNPSVSPFKISANGLVVESSNPAVRLYRYNTYTGEVIQWPSIFLPNANKNESLLQIYDYAQYYLDLAEANRKMENNEDKSANLQPDQTLLAASSLTSAGAAQEGLLR